MLLLLVAGTVGGYLAQLFKLPGGAALGAMMAAVVVNVALGDRPASVQKGLDAALVLVGVTVGAAVTRDTLAGAANLIAPSLLILGVFSGVGVVLALVLRRFFGFDLTTALFAAAPGGISSMAVLAKDAGGNGFSVALIHLVRVLGIFIFIPAVAFFMRRF